MSDCPVERIERDGETILSLPIVPVPGHHVLFSFLGRKGEKYTKKGNSRECDREGPPSLLASIGKEEA
jgi:hypothetical protein